MTLEEVQKDFELQAHQAQLVGNEVERLKQQLASEKRNASDTSMELQALKFELEKSKNEAEHLRLMERHFEERRYLRSNSRLELEDAKSTIAELKEELSYKSSVNRSLGLQLEKTIESNSELLLEIKDLDDLLQSKEKEIEQLKADIEKRHSSQRADDEKEEGSLKSEENEQIASNRARYLMLSEVSQISETSDDSIQDIRAQDEKLQKRLEELEAELSITSKENTNLSSQVMDLQDEIHEKNSLVLQLEQRLTMVEEQASLDIKALETTASGLLANVNDLRQKLQLSEESSQRQIDSKEVFIEDLVATVEALQGHTEQLESSIKSSEDKQAGLVEELEALQRELLAHEKERSLLVSQRGQLKALRERIATLAENNEIACERGDNLELAMKAMKEEHCQTLAHHDEQIKQLECRLQDSNVECMALKEGLQKAEIQAEAGVEETNLLLAAKEDAEARSDSLDVALAALQEQYNLIHADKENTEASLRSLQTTYAALKEQLKVLEQGNSEALHKVEEQDLKIAELTEALDSAERQLQEACEKASNLEDTLSAMQEQLQHMETNERLQNARIENLQLELAGTKDSLNNSRISLSESEDRMKALEVRNDDLSEMLQSAVSFKEDVVSRMEGALEKQRELENKLQETEQAFENLKCEKASSDQTIEELQERICVLKDERVGSLKGKDEDKDVREMHKILRTQVEVLKQSTRELKWEKDKAESSMQKLQTTNTNLVKELNKWKEKVKACNEEIVSWKEKIKTNKRLSASSEEKTCQQTDLNVKCAKKSTDLNSKSELLKVRKQAADLRRKLLEQEEEKEDLQKKLASCQKELQRKEELVNVLGKRSKENKIECQGGQRPLTRQTSSTTHKIGMLHSNGRKISTDLTQRVRLLEAELNTKNVELEATQFLLKEKECVPENGLHIYNDETGVEYDMNATRAEYSDDASVQVQNKLLLDTGSHRILTDEVQRLSVENQRLERLLMDKKEETELDDHHAFEGNNQGVLPRDGEDDQCVEKMMNVADLQEELREIRERYSQMSLQFAEQQVEKEELLITIRNLSNQ